MDSHTGSHRQPHGPTKEPKDAMKPEGTSRDAAVNSIGPAVTSRGPRGANRNQQGPAAATSMDQQGPIGTNRDQQGPTGTTRDHQRTARDIIKAFAAVWLKPRWGGSEMEAVQVQWDCG